MKLVLTVSEVKQVLLDKINEQFVTAFTDVKFDYYGDFESATFEVAKPKSKAEAETPEELP